MYKKSDSGGTDRGKVPRVSFLIVGAQKSGTTALHTLLSAHPGIYVPRRKELHFFDNNETDWENPDYTRYEEEFSAAPQDAICGEATPVYMFLPSCAARIHAYNSAMRLIVILRDPVERAYSHWRMEVTRGRETLGFSEAIREGRGRFGQNWRIFSYVERGFYADQIRRLYDLFPRDQCLILTTTDLWSRSSEVLPEVWSFLGLHQSVPIPERRMIRPMPLADLPDIQEKDASYLRALYRPAILETQALIDKDLGHWLDPCHAP